MEKYRGKIEGGLCVRRVEQIQADSEVRYFVVDRICYSPDGGPVPELVEAAGTRIDSRFFSVDVARRSDGELRIIEIGDGQVSDLGGVDGGKICGDLATFAVVERFFASGIQFEVETRADTEVRPYESASDSGTILAPLPEARHANHSAEISLEDRERGYRRRRYFQLCRGMFLEGRGFVAPSEKVNIALVGAGGQGRTNVRALFKEAGDAQIIALADPMESVSLERFISRGWRGGSPVKAEIEKHYSETTPNFKCTTYEDFRVMLEKEKAIDAVLCATPDHLHAYVTIVSMRAGKHTFCEKPLTHNIAEARLVAKVTKETKLATQMGNIGHSTEGIRQTVEWLRDGAIGTVREAHSWGAGFKVESGIAGEAEGYATCSIGVELGFVAGAADAAAVPPGVCAGDVAGFLAIRMRSAGRFRLHDMDAATWAFELPVPESVEVLPAGQWRCGNRAVWGDRVLPFSGARGSFSEFARRSEYTPRSRARGRQECPPHQGTAGVEVDLVFGGLRPAASGCDAPDLAAGRSGDHVRRREGCDSMRWSGRRAAALFRDATERYKRPEKTLVRSNGHHRDWVDAIKGGPPASANFEYGAKLTEITLLGVMSLRLGGKRIVWDATNMKAKNLAAADEIIHETRRNGWELA